jgi:RNA polymerase sigma-70 factor (ECF subfamily)
MVGRGVCSLDDPALSAYLPSWALDGARHTRYSIAPAVVLRCSEEPMPSPAHLVLVDASVRVPAAFDAATMTAEDADREILRRLARHEIAALDEAFARNWAPLLSYVTRITGTREAAEDIAQQAFYRLWERRETLRIDGSLRGFLYYVARNMAISHRRSDRVRARAVTAHQMDQPTSVSIELGYEGLSGELQRALRALSDRRREILLLHSVDGLSHKEIARLLGIAPQTVANQFSAALNDLRRLLSGRPIV